MRPNDDSLEEFDTFPPLSEAETIFWHEPLPSRASRGFSREAKRTGRSSLAAIFENPPRAQIVIHESLLESDVSVTALARRDIIDLVEQLPPVDYFDEAHQKWKTHHFDLLATMADGTKTAIAVRAEERVEEVRRIVKAIADQGCTLADAYAVVTDADLPENLVKNSELILAVRRDEDRSADKKIRQLVRTLYGATTVAMLVAASGLEGKAFRAIVRMIDEGELEVDRNVLIDYPAIVRRPAIRRAAA